MQPNDKKYSRLICCDLDGTLTRPKEGKQFPASYSDQELYEGAYEALSAYKERGYGIAIVSNQGGVEAGFKTVYQTCLQMRHVMDLLPQVDVAYFSCENHPASKSRLKKLLRYIGVHRNDCYWVNRNSAGRVDISEYIERWHLFNGGNDKFIFRKPHAGMLFVALTDLAADTIGSLIMTGDRPEDKAASSMMGSFCRFIPADDFRKMSSQDIELGLLMPKRQP